MSFQYSVSDVGSKIIISFRGKLIEKDESDTLLIEISDLINQGTSFFAIDLKNLEYFNSTGLNILLKMLTKARNAGGEVVLFNCSARLNELILLTKLDSVFTMASDKNDALGKLDQKINSKKSNES